MSYLTPEAKSKLSNTIRALRERLLTDLHNAVDGAYQLSISLTQAGLSEEMRLKRQRLENWLSEQSRTERQGKKEKDKEIKERYLRSAEKLAAATLLNRLVVIKQMEAHGLIKPAVVTHGWQSPGYREFRDFAPELLQDESEGYSILLQLLYDELALDLPGLFGNVGITPLFPIPASTLRAVIEALNNPALQDAWMDDTTLGWVYQYWNDPEREALDAKLNDGGKVEQHEIASKTQMFTERYMVEWMLHNTLGQMWLAMCKKNKWIAEVEADGTLERLEQRRKEWRQKRENSEVALDALMPIETEAEDRWKYWVPQPLTDSLVENAPKSLKNFKMIDPACGSGHYLVIAFSLLFALYQEEACHRQENWSDEEIVESILENNLYGIDIDPRAVQIAAAALILKARLLSSKAQPHYLNLVASNLELSALPKDDPALVELRHEVTKATGIPEDLTDQIVKALKGADYLGTLLKVDTEVDGAIRKYEEDSFAPIQRSLFDPSPNSSPKTERGVRFNFEQTKSSLLDKLENFLSRRTSGNDLGLRLRGEQLAAGIRFIRIVRENTYNIVIGNPPYQGTSKMVDAKYVAKNYPRGKADLYAAFLERALQLAKYGGISALLTMRGWMFLQQFASLREWVIEKNDLRSLGDVSWGAFSEMRDNPVTMSIICNSPPSKDYAIALAPTDANNRIRTAEELRNKIAGLLCGTQRYEFSTAQFEVIKEKPLIYWWDKDFLRRYAEAPKLGDETDVRQGMATSNNNRFLRLPWEIDFSEIDICSFKETVIDLPHSKWVPYIKGAAGKSWFEPLDTLIFWKYSAIEKQVAYDHFGSNGGGNGMPSRQFYFQIGIAFSMIGSTFTVRLHRFRSVIGHKGSSLFPQNLAEATCLLNSKLSRFVVSSLNPSVGFEVGDVNRLPLFPIESADEIFAKLDAAFTEHEAARETSVEFKQPSSSAWNYTQQWAQTAVDRDPDEALPDYQPVYEEPPATNFVSYSIGVALGRFGANGEGILTQEVDNELILPHGILYLSAYSQRDSLEHPAALPIITSWQKYGAEIAKGKSLREWLRLLFFKDVHLGMYENRPIYFPLSSQKKNFVAFVSIHRWEINTLQTLLADYLVPELSQVEGELNDLLEARVQGDKKSQSKAEDRYSKVQQLQTELKTFIDLVQKCAEDGPPPANPKDTPREADARFTMSLDDGVMVNSAALWPLLEPQWNQPKKWWSELCNAQGKKDYDWSYLSNLYFPDRVDEKCQQDPSLAVAHKCFWYYHPVKAYEWELRLQDEVAPDFTIDEINSNELRKKFEQENPLVVEELKEKEEKRRERKRKKDDPNSDYSLDYDIEQATDDEQM
jgi:Eco57I restriction-modification methylase